MHAVQVANKRTGADADRFDYLKRDSMMCGVAVPLDAKRLMLFSRLSPDRTQVWCAWVVGRGDLCRGVLKLRALQQPPSSVAERGCFRLKSQPRQKAKTPPFETLSDF